jgi:hypothetical protein
VYYESEKTVSRLGHLREANMSQGQPIRDASHLYEVERRVQHARVIMAWRDGKTNLSCSPRSPAPSFPECRSFRHERLRCVSLR